MAAIDHTVHVDASREVVFDVMTDHLAYPDFTPMRKAKLEKEGDPAPNGIGAIRKFKMLPLGPAIREEVIGYDAPATMSYKLLSGLPLKDHVGTITLLEANEGGTELRYHVESEPKLPVAKFIPRAITRKAISDLANGIKKEAEKRARG